MFKWLREIRRTDKSTSFSESHSCRSESQCSPGVAQQPRRFFIRQSLAQIEDIYGPMPESLIADNQLENVTSSCQVGARPATSGSAISRRD